MRLSRLDLLKFGKFSDRRLDFPQTPHDFHLVVGPNEAGKSTVRNAILDLFYGIGKTSAFNFMHAYGDMKLGARIEHEGKSLDFARTKGNKRTLTNGSGDVLADDALVPFLGATDRSFFDQMFGLDHDKLVRGGNDILNASNDIGQILFQSASGIGGLGDVRKSLEAEANLLWGPKKSSEREYYIARDELEKADAQLKQSTVRTKEWLEYSITVERLGGDFAAARARYAKLDQHRNQLERMRRVASALVLLRQKQADLQLLGAVTVLPANATSMLANAELELATATEAQQLHDSQASLLRAQFDLLDVKAGLLLRADDIQALTEMRQQVRAHEPDILKRQHEVGLLWQTAQSLARELGWQAQTEADLQARLPPALTRTAMAALIKKRTAVEQARSAADDALNGKLGEARALDAQASERVPMTVSPSVRAALDHARNLGDTAAAELSLRERLRRASAELAAAQAGLGNWPLPVDSLRAMQAPSSDQIDHFLAQQNRAATDRAYLAERLDDQQAAVRQVELDITQFQALHQPVTREQVADLRRERDNLWNAMKQGQRATQNTAAEYEAKVALADKMADLRHDGAQQVTELQAKSDALASLRLKLTDSQLRFARLTADGEQGQQQWDALVLGAGLPDMPLLAINSWLDARSKTLGAAESVADVQASLDDLLERVADATTAISGALSQRNSDGCSAARSLPALVAEATDLIDVAAQSRIREEELNKQRHNVEAAIVLLAAKAEDAQRAMNDWQRAWDSRITAAGLAGGTDVDSADAALALFTRIEDILRSMEELRRDRIDAMRADLVFFARQAQALAAEVAPDIVPGAPADIALELAARLAAAVAQDAESKRLATELATLTKKCDDAAERIRQARLVTQPLLHLAQVADHDALRLAIARSDAWRMLTDEITVAQQAAHAGGDNLSIAELEAELHGIDVTTIPMSLGEIDRERDVLLQQLNTLSVDHANALQALAQIAGSDDAARAESQRQRALARMANAAERYAKVHTAARLLRWAIDRYRQTRQGPMLEAASTIFSSLTLGNFKRLVVDFDSQPLALEAQRNDASMVGIAGLSDGTRDQLYLALRLAALELHLEQSQSLPFLADDLFINFDDARSRAGLEALAHLSTRTQVIFLSHHDHLVPTVQAVFGQQVNVVYL